MPQLGENAPVFKNATTKGQLPVLDKSAILSGQRALLLEIMEMPLREQNCWQTRVILNKFPALTPEEDTSRFSQFIW